MNKSELIATRGLNPGDVPFIFSTFLKALYHGSSVFSDMEKNTFMDNYHPIVERLLDPNLTTIKVACLKDDPEIILSYVILTKSESAIHFAFCKKAWRGIGVTKSLVPPSVTTVTHLNKVGAIIMRKKGLTFNPFAVK